MGRDIFVGFIIGLGASFLFTAIILSPEERTPSKFEVIDTYKGCNVVRFTDPSQNWQYFLHCK
jgi:hypothetical protein